MIKTFIDSHKWDLLVVLFVLLFSLAIWWPSHYYPLFWDSTFVVHNAQSILRSNFTNLVNPDPGYAQPTLIALFLALFWKLCGTSVAVSHLLMFPFLPVLLLSIYFFISKQTNRVFGLLGTALIAFTPVVLAEYVNVYVDLPTGAFIALSVLMWQQKKYWYWGIFYSFAILTKLPALSVAPYFFLSAFYLDRKKVLITVLLPVIVVASWLAYHLMLTGWFLTSPNISLAVTRAGYAPIPMFFDVLYLILTSQGKIYVTIAALFCLAVLYIKNHSTPNTLLQPKMYADVLPILIATLIFVITGEFGFRYAIFIYIFYVSIVTKIAYNFTQSVKKSEIYVYAALLIALAMFANVWHPRESALTTTRFEAPDDLGIIDYMYVFRSVAAFAQVHRAENFIYYGAFPENVGFTDPTFGFVQEPVPFQTCESFKYEPLKKQVIIIHPFSPTQYPCLELIKSQTVSLLSGSEHNGKWVDLYLVDATSATASAQKQ